MEQLFQWSQGNPGAVNFLIEVYAKPTTSLSDVAIIDQKLKKCSTIRGTNLYVLYSDLCQKSIDKVVFLCRNCPDDILEDACSRQDRSGIELVRDYLESKTVNT